MSEKSEAIFKAPGRICLFGDHQDYLGLPIIACAINRFVEIKAIVNQTDMFHIEMPDIFISRSFSIYENFETLQPSDFLASSIRVLKRYGCIPNEGFDILITGEIPINAGLSSSSAVVVAWVRFLVETFGCTYPITNKFIAEIAYEAEVLEHNSPGGRMDQYTIAIGDIIYLQTGKNTRFKKIKNTLNVLVVAESGVPKNTIGVLGNLKKKALNSIKIVQDYDHSFDLFSASLIDIDTYSHVLPKDLIPLFYASIKNHLITQAAFLALHKNPLDHKKIGKLMNEHHYVLKNKLKVTTPKIDQMIDAAIHAGAYGAKIVGSGGGGSICALTSQHHQEPVIKALMRAGAKDAYPISVTSPINDLMI